MKKNQKVWEASTLREVVRVVCARCICKLKNETSELKFRRMLETLLELSTQSFPRFCKSKCKIYNNKFNFYASLQFGIKFPLIFLISCVPQVTKKRELLFPFHG